MKIILNGEWLRLDFGKNHDTYMYINNTHMENQTTKEVVVKITADTTEFDKQMEGVKAKLEEIHELLTPKAVTAYISDKELKANENKLSVSSTVDFFKGNKYPEKPIELVIKETAPFPGKAATIKNSVLYQPLVVTTYVDDCTLKNQMVTTTMELNDLLTSADIHNVCEFEGWATRNEKRFAVRVNPDKTITLHSKS